MSLYKYFRISKPSEEKVPPEKVESEFIRLRRSTFWAVAVAYSLFYVCRMALSVVKQPLIDSGTLTAGALGVVDSAMLVVYAFGKFSNGIIADYCNVRRFMAAGLIVSVAANLLMGVAGLLGGPLGLTSLGFTILFAVLWGVNGWVQSMGAPPAVISLSRWFPKSNRGTAYSIVCSTPYAGKFLTFIIIGFIVGTFGWQWGFIGAAMIGMIGVLLIVLFVHDTPQSRGLPPIAEFAGEEGAEAEKVPTKILQKQVFRHPGIWVIALSSAFIYITQYAVSNWGVLFLQKAKDFPLEKATRVIAFSEAFGIAGTVAAGWLSDKLFRGDRVKPVLLGGIASVAALCGFLFTGGGAFLNILYVSVFSLAIGIVYCIVAGLMALDFVPRKATGAAMGIVGISSYLAAGAQSIVSGFLIQGGSDGSTYDFTPAALFWTAACLVSFILPVVGWKTLRKR